MLLNISTNYTSIRPYYNGNAINSMIQNFWKNCTLHLVHLIVSGWIILTLETWLIELFALSLSLFIGHACTYQHSCFHLELLITAPPGYIIIWEFLIYPNASFSHCLSLHLSANMVQRAYECRFRKIKSKTKHTSHKYYFT